MSYAILTDVASLVSSTIIGGKERLVHGRFDRRFNVYKATDDFIRNAFTVGLAERDVVDFYNITKEAYFLFDDALGSYLENDILAKGNDSEPNEVS